MSVANNLGGFQHKHRREHPRNFIKLLDHDDAYVRQIALDLLFEQSQHEGFHNDIKEQMHKVINHISDSEEVVCRVAADALAKFKKRFYEHQSMEPVFLKLINQFGNKDKLIRERAANSLIKLSKQDDFKTDIRKCIPSIEKFLKDNNAATREVAAYSLIKVSETGQYGAEIGEIITHLARLIGTSKGSIPEFAAETLVGLSKLGPNEEISNASPIPTIVSIIQDKTQDDDVRLVATRSLTKLVLIGKYKDIETAMPTCKELIIGENEKIRRAAALFLARLDRPMDPEQPESASIPEPKYSPIIPHRVREYRHHKATTECHTAKRTMPTEPWRRGEFDARLPSDISPWKRCIHPDGSPYYIYFYESKGDKKDKFLAVTEYESGLKELAKVAKSLYDRYQDEWRDRKAPDNSYKNFGMYLTPLEPGVVPRNHQQSNVEIGYYFVDFDWNQIFWCKADAGQVTLQKRTPTNSWEQKLSIRFLQHLGLFPNSNPPKWDIANFLRSSLVMSATLTGIDDNVASNPTLRVDSGTCSTILDLLGKLIEAEGHQYGNHQCHAAKTLPSENGFTGPEYVNWFTNDGYLNWFLGTVLEDLLLNSQSKANSAKTDPKPNLYTATLDQILGLGSFGIFSMYRYYLLQIWADRMVTNGEWDLFREAMSSEYADTNLLATVLLSANVGFLALNSAPNSAIVLSIISMLLSISSIALGTHNVLKHRILRSRQFFNPKAVDQYFSEASSMGFQHHDMRFLALFLSLPSTLLLWSLTNFVGALSLYIFSRNWSTPFDIPTAALLLFVLFLVAVTTYFFWGLFKKSRIQDVDDEERQERQK